MMSIQLEIRPLASLGILDAYDWYESQLAGLGDRFLSDQDEFFAMLLRNPNTCGFLEDNIRQGRLSTFPYLVVYEVFQEKVVVFSVFHASQNPDKKRKM